MANATHTIESQSEPGSVGAEQAKSMMSAVNSTQKIMIQPGIFRESRYRVYIFNVGSFAPMQANGRREHNVQRPPLVPVVMLPACPAGQDYVLCCSFPELVSQMRIDPLTEQPLVHQDEGIKVAQDIINPQNLTGNQWQEVSSPFHEGTDLGRFGLFYSTSEVPTAEELGKAKARVEKTYRAEITKAQVQARAGKQNEISELAHFAADHFRINEGWHTPMQVPDDCPNCGEPVKKGLAYHTNSQGAVCVLDWKRAVNAGVKTKADVPEELRWFKEKSSPDATAK